MSGRLARLRSGLKCLAARLSRSIGPIFPNREARAYAPSDGARGRAERGLGHGEALPGHARTSKTPPERARSGGSVAHGAVEEGMPLEEITGNSGLDPHLWRRRAKTGVIICTMMKKATQRLAWASY